MNFTPASSSDLPSAAVLTRAPPLRRFAVGGDLDPRLGIGDALDANGDFHGVISDPWVCTKKTRREALSNDGRRRSEVRTDAHEQMPRQARREEPLHRIARHRGVRGEGDRKSTRL